MTGADFTGARLTGAVFDGANTRGCVGCPSAAAEQDASAKTPTTGTAATRTAGGCWARAYKGKNFSGDSLSLVGPAEVANVAEDWGFSWDPQFESLRVGPNAVLTIFDDPHFRDRTATFQPGKQLADLDSEMGIFRTIRSMRLRCEN